MTQPMPSLPGIPDQVARYQLLSELGRGSMGHVYLALDPNIDRKVALKLFLPLLKMGAAEQWELRQRFVLEARAAGRLSHPGIVTIFDADTDSETGLSYLAMEWVNGPSLDDLIRESAPLSVERSTTIVEDVAEALYVAHRQGLVHRDIKPANILLESDGRAKVTDFGIAKLASMSITTTGWIPGSPFYMSPEQIRNEDIDRRSDLYALGAVLYQCLTGRLPFEAESLAALTHMILEIDPRPVRSLNPEVSPELAAVIDTALAKSPDDRFDSGREFARALELARTGRFVPPARAAKSGVPATPEIEVAQEPAGAIVGGTGTIGLGPLARDEPEGEGPKPHREDAANLDDDPIAVVEAGDGPLESVPVPTADEELSAGGRRTPLGGLLSAGVVVLAALLVVWSLSPVESEPVSGPSRLARLFALTPSFSLEAISDEGGIEMPTDPAEVEAVQRLEEPAGRALETPPGVTDARPSPSQIDRQPPVVEPAVAVVGEPAGPAEAPKELVLGPQPLPVAAPPSVVSPARAPSRLEVVYRNRIRNATVSVFVDEQNVYSGSVETENGFFGKALGKNFWTALELTPGEHVVDVRITGAGGKPDMVRRTTAVFEEGHTRRLRVSVTPLKKLKLSWKESAGG